MDTQRKNSCPAESIDRCASIGNAATVVLDIRVIGEISGFIPLHERPHGQSAGLRPRVKNEPHISPIARIGGTNRGRRVGAAMQIRWI